MQIKLEDVCEIWQSRTHKTWTKYSQSHYVFRDRKSQTNVCPTDFTLTFTQWRMELRNNLFFFRVCALRLGAFSFEWRLVVDTTCSNRLVCSPRVSDSLSFSRTRSLSTNQLSFCFALCFSLLRIAELDLFAGYARTAKKQGTVRKLDRPNLDWREAWRLNFWAFPTLFPGWREIRLDMIWGRFRERVYNVSLIPFII